MTTISRVENLEIIDEKVPEEKPIEVEDVEETDIEESVTEKEKRKGSATEKTLLAMLDAFGKFHNPRALVMEPKIFAVYMELLLRSSGKIQNAVMKCIFAYKLKFLAPYQ